MATATGHVINNAKGYVYTMSQSDSSIPVRDMEFLVSPNGISAGPLISNALPWQIIIHAHFNEMQIRCT